MTPRPRRMRWWDVEEAVRLEEQLFPGETWSAETFWAELAGWPGTRHYLVVTDGHGALQGYAGLRAPRRSDADVQTLAVAPAAQGGGLGTVLLQALVDEAQRRECPALLLEVRADNAAAQRLYARAGFERISVRRGYYDAGRVDALVLRRHLADGAA